jgi:hypothetical protein
MGLEGSRKSSLVFCKNAALVAFFVTKAFLGVDDLASSEGAFTREGADVALAVRPLEGLPLAVLFLYGDFGGALGVRVIPSLNVLKGRLQPQLVKRRD